MITVFYLFVLAIITGIQYQMVGTSLLAVCLVDEVTMIRFALLLDYYRPIALFSYLQHWIDLVTVVAFSQYLT